MSSFFRRSFNRGIVTQGKRELHIIYTNTHITNMCLQIITENHQHAHFLSLKQHIFMPSTATSTEEYAFQYMQMPNSDSFCRFQWLAMRFDGKTVLNALVDVWFPWNKKVLLTQLHIFYQKRLTFDMQITSAIQFSFSWHIYK